VSGILLLIVAISATHWAVGVAVRQAKVVAARPVPNATALEPSGSNRAASLPKSAQLAKPSMARPTFSTPSAYVITFGRFASRQEAEAKARRVRSKGYSAVVSREGSTFVVMSRAFSDRKVAESWSGVFKQIGLQAKVVAVRPPAINALPRALADVRFVDPNPAS